MHRVRLVAVLAEDRAGELARATKLLGEAGVNVRWVGIASGERFGVIRFLVDRTEAAQAALLSQGLTVSLNEVLAVEVEDRPGGLARVADVLARNGVNVANASGFVVASGRRAVLIIEVENVEEAQRLLRAKHLRLLTEEELVKL